MTEPTKSPFDSRRPLMPYSAVAASTVPIDDFLIAHARGAPKLTTPGWRPSESPVIAAHKDTRVIGPDAMMMEHVRNAPTTSPDHGRSFGLTSGRPQIQKDDFMHKRNLQIYNDEMIE